MLCSVPSISIGSGRTGGSKSSDGRVDPSEHAASLAVWFALAALASPAIAAPIVVLPGTPEVACPDRVAVQGALFAQVGRRRPGTRLAADLPEHR